MHLRTVRSVYCIRSLFPETFEPVNLPPQSMPAAGASAFFSAMLNYLRVAFVAFVAFSRPMKSMGSMKAMEHMARNCTNWRSRSRAWVINADDVEESKRLRSRVGDVNEKCVKDSRLVDQLMAT